VQCSKKSSVQQLVKITENLTVFPNCDLIFFVRVKSRSELIIKPPFLQFWPRKKRMNGAREFKTNPESFSRTWRSDSGFRRKPTCRKRTTATATKLSRPAITDSRILKSRSFWWSRDPSELLRARSTARRRWSNPGFSVQIKLFYLCHWRRGQIS